MVFGISIQAGDQLPLWMSGSKARAGTSNFREIQQTGGGQRRALSRLELWEAFLSLARNKCLPVLQM